VVEEKDETMEIDHGRLELGLVDVEVHVTRERPRPARRDRGLCRGLSLRDLRGGHADPTEHQDEAQAVRGNCVSHRHFRMLELNILITRNLRR
jgi:hypothetical protein